MTASRGGSWRHPRESGGGGVGQAFLEGETLEPCLEVQLEVPQWTRWGKDIPQKEQQWCARTRLNCNSLWPEQGLELRRGLIGAGGVGRPSHTGPKGTRESLKVLGREVTWSDCAFGRSIWVTGHLWSQWEQPVSRRFIRVQSCREEEWVLAAGRTDDHYGPAIHTLASSHPHSCDCNIFKRSTPFPYKRFPRFYI